MAVPRLRVPSSPHQAAGLVSDEVELYHRTYTTLLRSSGETLLRVLEPSHRSMSSSLHGLAASHELDLGAFLYATRRLPPSVWRARVADQIEWNKMRVLLRQAELADSHDAAELAEVLGGAEDDWLQLSEEWGDEFGERLRVVADRRLN